MKYFNEKTAIEPLSESESSPTLWSNRGQELRKLSLSAFSLLAVTLCQTNARHTKSPTAAHRRDTEDWAGAQFFASSFSLPLHVVHALTSPHRACERVRIRTRVCVYGLPFRLRDVFYPFFSFVGTFFLLVPFALPLHDSPPHVRSAARAGGAGRYVDDDVVCVCVCV